MFVHGESITVTRPGAPTGGFDAAGNPVLTADTTVVVSDVAVAPEKASEPAEPWGSQAVNGYTLYMPFGTDIRADDLVTVRGVAGWQVQGDVRTVDWVNPFSGWQAGTVAVVRRSS